MSGWRQRGSRSVRRVGLAAVAVKLMLIAAGLAVLWWGWRWHRHEGPPPSAAAPVRQAVQTRTSPESPPTPASAMVSPPTLSRQPLPSPGPAASAVVLPRTADRAALVGAAPVAPVWELCGVGRLSLRPGDASSAPLDRLPAHLGRDALVDAGAALMAALDGGSPRWRAAAVVLRGTDAAGRPQGLALRELAAAAPDAVTAMWATLRCEPKPGCMPLAAEHWVQVDGGNLAPLLFAVADAPPSLDVLQSLATADRFSVRETALSRTVLEAMPATVPAYLQPSLWNHAIGVEAAMALPSFKAAFDGCAEPLRPGMPAYAPCTAISRTLTERSDGIMGARLGLRLSERVGLPLAESRQQRASLDALLVPPRLAVNAQQPLSCDSIAAHRRWVEQRANLGELGALRAQAAQAAAGSAPTR